MDRVIATNSVNFAAADAAPSTGTPQYFTNGNPVTPTPATVVPGYFLNMLQDEVRKVITDAGITPDKNNWGQLSQAIQALIIMGAGRTKLTGATTFYVSPSGNDSTGNGTSGNPWLTVTHALSVVANNYDLAGFTITIQLADGTYPGFSLGQAVPGAAGNSGIVVNGNSITPANVIISSSGTSVATISGAGMTIQNMKLTSSAGNCVVVGEKSGIALGVGIIFGAAAASHILAGAAGASVDILQNYSIVGSAVNHINASSTGAWISYASSGITVTLTGTPAFSSGFASSSLCGLLFAPNITFAGSATGPHYSATLNGVIDTNTANVNYFPGNSAGSTATGGVYA